jgi:hypothetical protein
MGRSSAQVLKSLEYPAKSRIADKTDFRYESVIDAAGGAVTAGEFEWPISASRGSLTKQTAAPR